MIFVETTDLTANWMLNQIIEGTRTITKKEMLVLKELVRKNQSERLTEQKTLTDGRYLHIKRYRAFLVSVIDGDSKILKVFPLGNVPLKYQVEAFIKLSDKTGRKKSKQRRVVNRFRKLKEELEPKTRMEKILSKVVS